MFDVNSMIAANIVAILKKQNRKQIDLAGALQTNKQTISKMLNVCLFDRTEAYRRVLGC